MNVYLVTVSGCELKQTTTKKEVRQTSQKRNRKPKSTYIYRYRSKALHAAKISNCDWKNRDESAYPFRFPFFAFFSSYNEKVKQTNSCMKLKFETVDVIQSTLFSPLLLFSTERKEERLAEKNKHGVERKFKAEYGFSWRWRIIKKNLL